ncbi:hypothetical protein ACH6CV_13305 [Bacillota bacterium Meth-B3]
MTIWADGANLTLGGIPFHIIKPIGTPDAKFCSASGVFRRTDTDKEHWRVDDMEV